MEIFTFSRYFAYTMAILGFSLFTFLIIKTMKTDAGEIKKKGTRQTATIVDITAQSGGNSAFINVIITARFVTQDQKKIIAKAPTVISVLDTAKYQPGESVPIKYLSDNPQKIIIDIPSPLQKKK
ncbi:DUF3592 domain-containing protein [Entomohabitans teleogrylli]|uniref:DUF3592 domain-containing protein n=1 Tax=Entomohabitans teleogrylli TaxID=1384589 RepID=UPI00073D555B|nr:DUF3592 domain-containing protein [Entomohabitans teleogrylli]